MGWEYSAVGKHFPSTGELQHYFKKKTNVNLLTMLGSYLSDTGAEQKSFQQHSKVILNTTETFSNDS